MKKIDYDVAEYLVNKMDRENRYEYFTKFDNEKILFQLNTDVKAIYIYAYKESLKYQGRISTDGTLKPHLPFASQLFDLAIDGINKEFMANSLDKELPINNAVKTKKLKI